MRQLLRVTLALVVATSSCHTDSGGPVLARVGRTQIRRSDVARRAAAASVSICCALESAVEEELLIAEVCGGRPPPAACTRGDRQEILGLAIEEASEPVEPLDIVMTSQESEFLRQRLKTEPGLAANLAGHRSLRARLEERARRARASLPVTLFVPCPRSSTDAGS
jgi:hypothetical protein